MLLSLGYLTSLFYYIPKAALAAVIISAVAPLLDARLARTLWRVRSACSSSVRGRARGPGHPSSPPPTRLLEEGAPRCREVSPRGRGTGCLLRACLRPLPGCGSPLLGPPLPP